MCIEVVSEPRFAEIFNQIQQKESKREFGAKNLTSVLQERKTWQPGEGEMTDNYGKQEKKRKKKKRRRRRVESYRAD